MPAPGPILLLLLAAPNTAFHVCPTFPYCALQPSGNWASAATPSVSPVDEAECEEDTDCDRGSSCEASVCRVLLGSISVRTATCEDCRTEGLVIRLEGIEGSCITGMLDSDFEPGQLSRWDGEESEDAVKLGECYQAPLHGGVRGGSLEWRGQGRWRPDTLCVEWQSLDPAVECRVLVAVEADGNREQLKLEDCKMLQQHSCAGKAPATSPVLAEGPVYSAPASCADLHFRGSRTSRVYPVTIAGDKVEVYCDMDTDGGGWTVLQRRGFFCSPEDYFFKTWKKYQAGFGDPSKDHWVGLTYWSNLTMSTPQQLLIEMEDWEGDRTRIAVNNFIIGTESFKFRLTYASVDGEFGESLPKSGIKFSTLDNDNDAWKKNCARRFKGAWWYSACHNSNLNGLYLKGKHEAFGKGVNWYHWKGYHYSVKSTEMKIRPQSQAVTLGFLRQAEP